MATTKQLREKRRLIRLAKEKRKLQKTHTGLNKLVKRTRQIHAGLEMEYEVFPDDHEDEMYFEPKEVVGHFDINLKNKKFTTDLTRLPADQIDDKLL